MNSLRIYYEERPAVRISFTEHPEEVQPGETVAFKVRGENTTEDPVTFDAWFVAEGQVTRTLDEYFGLTLQGGSEGEATLSFDVPMQTPQGLWNVIVYVGDNPTDVWDSDEFEVWILE